MEGKVERQTDIQIVRQADRQTEADRLTYRQTDRGRHTDRHTG